MGAIISAPLTQPARSAFRRKNLPVTSASLVRLRVAAITDVSRRVLLPGAIGRVLAEYHCDAENGRIVEFGPDLVVRVPTTGSYLIEPVEAA